MKDCLIVDGYNIIYSWTELKKIAENNLKEARNKLINYLINYQSWETIQIIIVFDAHQIKGGTIEYIVNKWIKVIYTAEYIIADIVIERLVYKLINKFKNIKVATSDYLEQRIILGVGAYRITAKELEIKIKTIQQKIKKKQIEINQKNFKNSLWNRIDVKTLNKLKKIRDRNY